MPKAQIVEPVQRMTRTQYRAWAERQASGRFQHVAE